MKKFGKKWIFLKIIKNYQKLKKLLKMIKNWKNIIKKITPKIVSEKSRNQRDKYVVSEFCFKQNQYTFDLRNK